MTILKSLVLIAALSSISACSSFSVNLNQQHSQTWLVAAQKNECIGVAAQQCMLIKRKPNDEWQKFYDPIEGFSYQKGFEYKLRVAVTPIEQPMADGSDRRYTLLDILSKEASK